MIYGEIWPRLRSPPTIKGIENMKIQLCTMIQTDNNTNVESQQNPKNVVPQCDHQLTDIIKDIERQIYESSQLPKECFEEKNTTATEVEYQQLEYIRNLIEIIPLYNAYMYNLTRVYNGSSKR